MWKNIWCLESSPGRFAGSSDTKSKMLKRLSLYLSFVRFSHTVFALPFALAGALLASRQVPVGWRTIGWILVAMVAARSAAMGFNRLADARIDALNPRTANRELPRGAMSIREATIFVVLASAAFVFAASRLNPICLVLSPVALAIVFWYSLAKRYTTWTQLFLGLAMAVAPVGGWLAVGGRGGLEPWLLALAIGTWVGGFDVLYACQDLEFDRAQGLRSIPVRFGVPAALTFSRVMHIVAVVCLGGLAWVTPLSSVYLVGVAVVGLLLLYEQSLVRADDLSQVKRAFDMNGYVGILYLLVLAVSI
jgi:4-hydroxybenzoate polyprenyltransferase